jgi:hypothetical protein
MQIARANFSNILVFFVISGVAAVALGCKAETTVSFPAEKMFYRIDPGGTVEIKEGEAPGFQPLEALRTLEYRESEPDPLAQRPRCKCTGCHCSPSQGCWCDQCTC